MQTLRTSVLFKNITALNNCIIVLIKVLYKVSAKIKSNMTATSFIFVFSENYI